ncbi:MAG: Crp/Fnr family transcriptional regulator [Bdellovibrionales bacterium]
MSVRKIIAEKLMWETLKRWKKSSPELDRIEFLRTVPFFGELSTWQLKRVEEVVFERAYEPNELIFEQGQPGAALFLIMEGQVAVEIYHEKFTANLATLERGAFFGEMALLDQSPRSASARATVKTRTLALYRNDLIHLSQSDPETACQIYRALAGIIGDRLRSTNELVQETTGERVAA